MNNLVNEINKIPKDEFNKLTAGKKIIIFDLDGTLTESKTDMDEEMAELFGKLLSIKQVAVIGGQQYSRFKEQFLNKLSVPEELFQNLYLFPTTATSFYRHINNDWHKHEDSDWQKVYSQDLTEEEKTRILDAFKKTFADINYIQPEKIYGELIEDRGTQMTFSALGQKAPLALKEKWKREHADTKLKIAEILRNYLPDMEVGVAGWTSIDVTHKGVDKEYGVKQIKENLGIDFEDMLFVGDALFPGGNDSAVLRTSVLCFEVKSVEDTKQLIMELIS